MDSRPAQTVRVGDYTWGREQPPQTGREQRPISAWPGGPQPTSRRSTVTIFCGHRRAVVSARRMRSSQEKPSFWWQFGRQIVCPFWCGVIPWLAPSTQAGEGSLLGSFQKPFGCSRTRGHSWPSLDPRFLWSATRSAKRSFKALRAGLSPSILCDGGRVSHTLMGGLQPSLS